jgi:hypothetical protein
LRRSPEHEKPRAVTTACHYARERIDARRRAHGRKRAPPKAPKRILIAHHLLLGDTIMLTPLIAKCRVRWPDAEIVMTCAVPYAGLYAGRPYGVRALPYDPRDPATLKPLLAQTGFDLALIPGDNRLSWLARALGARWIVAFSGDQSTVQGLAGGRVARLSRYADCVGRSRRRLD